MKSKRMLIIGGACAFFIGAIVLMTATSASLKKQSAAVFSGIEKKGTTATCRALYLIGGHGESPMNDGNIYGKNDVWIANVINGTWSQATANAPWTGRAYHTSVFFNNKLWVMGGLSESSGSRVVFDDIWSSPDGINWIQEVVHAPWGERMSFASAVFQNKIWIMGGKASNNNQLFGNGPFDDIWSSPDGINWTQEVVHAPWSERQGLASVVFQNKLWMMGGRSNFPETKDVWSSSDGIHWNLETSTAPWAGGTNTFPGDRVDFASAVFQNKMWVMGGDGTTNGHDVWSSLDGINWTLAVNSAPWASRAEFPAISLGNKLVTMGGLNNSNNGGPALYNDVWKSLDGITWTPVTAVVPWVARDGFTLICS